MAQLSIGELARILNVSRRTLRYYEEVGIVVPKSRGSNNYRYYDTNDLNRLQAVMLMRKAGLSLKEVLDTVGPADRRSFDFVSPTEAMETGQELAFRIQQRLLGQKLRLAEKIAELQGTLDSIQRSIHALESCLGCVSSVTLDECVDCRKGCSEVADTAARRHGPVSKGN